MRLVADIIGRVEPLLEITGVRHGYNGHRVLNEFSFALARGQIGCILGPSGCGKTTALRCIAGFEKISAGRIAVNGADVSRPGHEVPPEQRRIGMVFQDYALFPHLTVEENVGFGLRHLGGPARASATRCCCPPDNSRGKRCSKPDSRKVSSSSTTRDARSPSGTLRAPNARFCSTVRCGKRA